MQYLLRTSKVQQCPSELAQRLSTVNQHCAGNEDVDEGSQNVEGTMLTAFNSASTTSPIGPNDQDVIEIARKRMAVVHEHDIAYKSLKRQIVKSLRKDRELWWTMKVRELESYFTTGNSRALYQLIRSTGHMKATRVYGCEEDANFGYRSHEERNYEASLRKTRNH
ncbi:hypothetical protein CLF_104315 [Clonorchis sinensis]|uniref:Uncharacterized protein n=1 Tax=Clonorchis sinensis TaxID=79923 RepID=H2KQN0_CLOSI|nr:hypothetical protein CLF_104315 [Clonorchis sinensis]